jgi:hypothetical protein
MVDAFFTPVLVAAGFNEREHTTVVNDGGTAYHALCIIMADKQIADAAREFAIALDREARAKHAAAGETQPYDSVVMAVQMLTPQQRAALRTRVLERLKLATKAD